MSAILTAYRRAVESGRKLEERRAEALEAARPFMDHIDLITELLPNAKIQWIDELRGPRLCLAVTVTDMDELLPILEALEKRLRAEFDKSEDYASQWLSFRTFTSKAVPWLRVDAEVRLASEDSLSCKAVVVGYKAEPVYEIQCEEKEAL